MFKRSVVCRFCTIGETAAGKLAAAKVVADTLTAYPLARARFVTAVAGSQILRPVAFHNVSRCASDVNAKNQVSPKTLQDFRATILP